MITEVRKSQIYSMGTSFGIHVLAIAVMFFIKVSLPQNSLSMVLDSVFSEERFQEEFEHEIEQTTEIATSMNTVEGQSFSTAVGTGSGGTGGSIGVGGGSGGTAEKLEGAASLKEPSVPAGFGNISVPGTQFLADEMGTGVIKGDVGRVVDGYGTALSQMTQELVRLMREQRLTVVWLFDESESMRDDQKEIRDKFHKVYEELGLATKHDAKLKATEEILLTAVTSYGKDWNEHTKKGLPTAKVEEVREAMDDIQIEESGKENMCKAISSALAKYGQIAQRQRRRLAVVVVSDESGDDGELVEDVIEKAKKLKAPIYVLGRYSVFGYPYARMTWYSEEFKLTWWLTINRGPETPRPELLQTDGLHERWDYDSAGFGPYEQVRLARETGGIFFMLPGTEDNISGSRSVEDRRFELLDMKEYLPDLSARVSYERERDTSKFRNAQWQVINVLNPHRDEKLQIQEIHYSADPGEFDRQGGLSFEKAIRSLQLFNEALRLLDSVKKDRDKERSQRWRANYDLIHAQCKAYRVRLFQLLLALDQHKKLRPVPKIVNGVQNNLWNAVRQKVMLPPDPEQVKMTKVNLEELNAQMEEATKEFQAIIENHPRTPWARRAQHEMDIGFGIMFVDGFYDFTAYRNAGKVVKVPTP